MLQEKAREFFILDFKIMNSSISDGFPSWLNEVTLSPPSLGIKATCGILNKATMVIMSSWSGGDAKMMPANVDFFNYRNSTKWSI